MMKHLKPLGLSILILYIALLFQPGSDKETPPMSNASVLIRSGSEGTTNVYPVESRATDYVELLKMIGIDATGIDLSRARPADPVGTSTPTSDPLHSAEIEGFPTPSPVHKSAIEPSPTPARAPTATIYQVTAYEPRKNALLDDLHVPLVIAFNRRPVDVGATADALAGDSLLQILPPAEGHTTWRDDRTLVFTPEPGWEPNTRYEIRWGDVWHSWFRTDRLIGSVFPSPDDAISPHTKFMVEFGVRMDRASVENAFTLSPRVSGRSRWTDDMHFVFEPEQPLAYASAYRVSLDGGLQDAKGMALPDTAAWSFTTRSAIISAKPKGTVGVDSTVQIKFDAPVDQDSVEAALVITPSVAGSYQWQGNTLTFSPDDFLDPYTTYHVTLAATARDGSGGRLLGQDYGWRFSTGDIRRTVDFGYGPNIQLLGVDGSRSVQLQSYSDRPVTLRLYALDVPQFLDRYTSSFRGVGPGEDKPINTQDLPLVLTWEQDLGGRGEVSIPATVSPGLYVLEAQSGPGNDRLIVALTRHVLVLKQADRQIVTWASSIVDHAPAADMHLRFFDRDGTLVAEGTTEGRGLHRSVVPVDTEPLIVIGESNGDITVSGLSPEWKDGWSWWGWWETSPSAPEATIYPYTDRPIYRPGQTVHTRAVVRRDDDAVYSLPDGVEVVLRLRDARDNVIATRRLTPDEFGAVYADFEIADGGTVGTYNLEVSALGETARQPFLVEAYRKPDYELTVTPSTDHAVAGEPLTLTVQARYFFGAPVANAEVELVPYVVYSNPWYVFEPGLDYGYAYEKLRQIGRTDAEGCLTVVLPADVTNDREQQTWNIEATVTDASDLSVSGHTRVVVHRAGFGLSLHTDRFHYRPGEPIPVTLLARNQHNAVEAGVGLIVGLYDWESTARDYSHAVVEVSAAADIHGRSETTLQTSQPGWYQLRAASTDYAGRQVEAHRWILVYDEGSGVWGAGSNGELQLSTDRDRYAPGDSARLLIESPVSGPALLSFERGTTRRETVIQLREGPNTLDFELLPDDVPNVHVAAAVWRPTAPEDERWRWQSRSEQELLTASTEILVPADDARLTVTIEPDRDHYAPRDEAAFLVEIRDRDGRPVRAGFSLALVDEAIFALAADETPDIFDAFYQPRPDLVCTYHSLRPTRWLDGGRGGGGGGGDLAGSPRSDFPDTAFWAAALTTDLNGKALVRVPLPDSLTNWRVVVRAVTVDTKAGQATANVTVALSLSIQPVLPRFLVQADRATLTAVVHNHTGERRVASVQMTANDLELDAPLSATQQITLPANGTVAVDWEVVARNLGQASVRMDVALPGGQRHDAVVIPLLVIPRAAPQVTTVTAEVEGEWVETIVLPDAGIPDITRWELSLAPTIATGMLDGLEFLIDYPFG